jgi:hypothetical protein
MYKMTMLNVDGIDTRHTETKRCDSCWELESRIISTITTVQLAQQIIDNYYKEKDNE